jgi:hypothetical protein
MSSQKFVVVREVPNFILFEVTDSSFVPQDTLTAILVNNYSFDGETLRIVDVQRNEATLRAYSSHGGEFMKIEVVNINSDRFKEWDIEFIVCTSYGYYVDRKSSSGFLMPFYSPDFFKLD